MPEDNFYRELESKVDLSFVRELVSHLYKPYGRASIDPVVFFKLQIIMFFEAIRSERQLMEAVALRLDHRWYLGYDLNETLPDHSSLTKIRNRFGVTVFKQFFEQVVALCTEAGLVWGEELHFDGSRIQADAAGSAQVPRYIYEARQHLSDVFQSNINLLDDPLIDKYDGTKSLVKRNYYRRKSESWVRPTDPWATPSDYQKLGYHLQYGIDGGKARIIVSCLVTPSAIQDNTPFLDLVRRTQFRWQLSLKRVVADARFGTVPNIVGLEQQGMQAFMPLHTDSKRKKGKQKTFGSDQFHFDPEKNHYVCSQGEYLTFRTHDNHTQRIIYQASDEVCRACPIMSQCTTGKTGRRVGHSFFKAILDHVRSYYDTDLYKKSMRKRQVWVEPKFGELKQWHLGRRFRLRGIAKVNIEALLHAAGQNIKSQKISKLTTATTCEWCYFGMAQGVFNLVENSLHPTRLFRNNL